LCSFDDPQFNVSTRDQVYDDLLRVHAAPNVSDEDKANGGVPYATNFVANWGNEDGQRLMPGALDYTVYRVVDDKRASRLFGRESWDLMLAAAVGLPVEGLEPLGIRGDYGYPSPLSPPVGSSERKKEGKKLRSLEQKAKEALGSLELEGALFWGGLRFHAFKLRSPSTRPTGRRACAAARCGRPTLPIAPSRTVVCIYNNLSTGGSKHV
jgi:hypothetical protein